MATATWVASVESGRRRNGDQPTPKQTPLLVAGRVRGSAGRRAPTRAARPLVESVMKRDAGPSLAIQSSCRRAPALVPAVDGSGTRKLARRRASKRRAATRLEVDIGLGNQMVELAGAGIRLDLSVPRIGSKLLVPRSEMGELLRAKTTDGRLNLLNAHRKEFYRKKSNSTRSGCNFADEGVPKCNLGTRESE